jgi:putative ATPase
VLQTTLAKIIANGCKTKGKYKFTSMSATAAGVNDVKEAVKLAKNDQRSLGRRTIIFLDEIHRFNKLQQVMCTSYSWYIYFSLEM